jgi:broad specificity phosphatase PhoE
VDVLFLARHGESELSVRGIVSGEPSARCRLTRRGKEQARDLGKALLAQPLELVATSDFDRCRTTARLALAEREVDWLELPELGDIRNGIFEARLIDDYRHWADTARPDDAPPGGGESRTDVARRLARAIRILLLRPESAALVVSHQLPIGLVLTAARRRAPGRHIDSIPYAFPFALAPPELEAAAETLTAWAADPRCASDGVPSGPR